MANKPNDDSSLSHTRWNCKYHIVFIPKYRRKEIFGKIRADIGQILVTLCRYKGVQVLEGYAMVDHVHMLVMIPPKLSVSSFMGYLKGKSSLMIFEKWGNARYAYRNREFWCKGYYVDTVGKDTKKIAAYIQNQLKEDELSNQLTMEEFDPFTGSK
jgi:putative transposase